ncbi:hypothetical protein [Reyranella sp.]|uniref:hypothetical protein n=1 Tax=Reyranella sp. TaxID=1929291 RepID=UPI003D108996
MMYRPPALRFARPSVFEAWSPLDLDEDLLAWWPADRPDLVTKDGSNVVTSWRDAVHGYEATAAGSARPTWQETGYGTRNAISFDGSANVMAYESMEGLPTGATPCEEWMAVDQRSLAAATSTTVLGTAGGTSTGTRRGINRAVVSGVNRLQVGDTSVSVTVSTVDFSGPCVVRSIATGSTLNAEINGVAGTPAACTPNIGTVRVRFGANQATTPASNATAAIADRLFTRILSAMQAALLRAYLARV